MNEIHTATAFTIAELLLRGPQFEVMRHLFSVHHTQENVSCERVNIRIFRSRRGLDGLEPAPLGGRELQGESIAKGCDTFLCSHHCLRSRCWCLAPPPISRSGAARTHLT